MSIESRQSGVTLIELVVFIVVVSVAVVGVLSAINQAVRSSADPVAPKQALAIAEALMEEIQLMPFTFCDPDDPLAVTAKLVAHCGVVEGIGAEAGETRSGATPFDNVNDYHGYVMAGIVDVTGAAVPGLGAYTASVTVAPVALGPAASLITAGSGNALLITVTVTRAGMTPIVLEGYRTRYAPNSLP